MQTVYFFFDDSGTLHRNEKSGYFVYAGYAFTNRNDLDAAKRKYINANKKLKKELKTNEELKAYGLSNKHRRALFNSVKEYDSVSCSVKIPALCKVLYDKKSVCRYKDYVLKRCVKAMLQKFIKEGRINPSEDIELFVNVDEQQTATNGYYDLKSTIFEELKFGIQNWDYGTFHKPIFYGDVKVYVKYCDSKKNYLIQASDILANRVWNSFRENKSHLRTGIPNHLHLTFP